MIKLKKQRHQGAKTLLGTIVNVLTIILGTLLGTALKNRFDEKIKNTVMQGLSLTVMVIGISMAVKTENMLVLTLSVVIGGIIGELLKIEERLDGLGRKLEAQFTDESGSFTRAFVTASLMYCVGAMAVLGSIQSGLNQNYDILFVKSLLDGTTAIVFSSTMGIGVAFSAIPVLLYQGAITLAASSVKDLLTASVITEMSAAGGLLIFGIGINMLNTKVTIKVGNLLPAIFVAIPLAIILAGLS
ncbi:hypothetical protein TSYNT_6257 [Tepidanaerobacter syntrophicus]|uniref:DUF554 domain-containing protein n=1 Tax=Tepidanaerobacter syntrophicus TaxID=224999 RepID=A0A0U9HHX6_9FIRM|nr:DUF554 domain-containing protein [Tepidanaerobacter syntrophicus]GAQ24876.1 hypothetical protein TSYNT_6257 [Tepidanaerobacter syntrophicus]